MSLLIAEQPLQILPKLAANIGLNEAILVQQIHYWLQRSKHNHDGQKWIYNTHESWLEQFPFWSKATLKRVITSLKSQGLINTGNYNRMKMDRTVWYTINYSHAVCSGISESQPEPTKDTESQADQPLGQSEPMLGSDCTDVDTSLTSSHKLNMTSPIPETPENTTETTTDIKSKPKTIDIPEWLDSELLTNYVDMRKANKKPMTDNAIYLLIKKITRERDKGYDANQMLEDAIIGGYQTVYPKDKSKQVSDIVVSQSSYTPKQLKNQAVTAQVLDINNTDW